MASTGLIRERISDRNGVRRTVWVRPRGNKGYERKDLVQMDPSDHSGFLSSLKNDGIGYEGKRIKVGDLKPTQRDIDQKKVDRIAHDLREKGFTPFTKTRYLISSDGHILDGQHRWAAMRQVDEDHEVPVYQIDLPIDKLITQARSYKAKKNE